MTFTSGKNIELIPNLLLFFLLYIDGDRKAAEKDAYFLPKERARKREMVQVTEQNKYIINREILLMFSS